MEEGILYIHRPEKPKLEMNRKEVLRYMGMNGSLPEDSLAPKIESCVAEVKAALDPRACYTLLALEREMDGTLNFGIGSVRSAALQKNLLGCRSVVLFAATVGIGVDRLMQAGRLEPVKALIYQAAGAAAIEAYCDCLCEEIRVQAAAQGLCTRPRFSPGYGDFPLEHQREIFRVLDCPRKIGLTLTDSCIMVPVKSVTAVMGLSEEKTPCVISGCENCGAQCAYRRES